VFPSFDEMLGAPAGWLCELRDELESDYKLFCQWAFWHMSGAEFQWTQVQELKALALQCVSRGYIKRLIINEPPRFSKTEMVSILWPTWETLRNPACRWLLISGSEALVKESSARVRNFLESPIVRLLWPKIRVSDDSAAKDLWRVKGGGGGFRAVPIGGQITGFGAGVLNAFIFSGAIIIDDPMKAQESESVNRMEVVNQIYTTTIKNRKNDRNTPIVVVAQRLHDNDLPGFLLNGGSGEKWHHLRLPGCISKDEEDNANARYQRDWSYGIPLEHNLPEGFPWPDKYGPEEDEAERINMDVWATQKIQNPKRTKGAFFQVSWFRRYQRAEISGGLQGFVVHPDGTRIAIKHMEVYADTADKIKEANDYSVFQLWGLGEDRNIYLLDQLRGKWEDPDLVAVSKEWLRKYIAELPRRYGWREVCIEDKSSGSGLIAWLKQIWGSRVVPIQRVTDKVSRAHGVTIPLHAGRVYIPTLATWLPDYLAEFAAFSKHMTHVHDDQIDPTIDAITRMLGAPCGSMSDVVGWE
jgi:predicted phage terminase large subunit-like protein